MKTLEEMLREMTAAGYELTIAHRPNINWEIGWRKGAGEHYTWTYALTLTEAITKAHSQAPPPPTAEELLEEANTILCSGTARASLEWTDRYKRHKEAQK